MDKHSPENKASSDPIEDRQVSRSLNKHLNPISKKLIPFWMKAGFSFFVIILIPNTCNHFGIASLFWLCYISILLTLAALWSESPLIASMAPQGVFIMQLLWIGGLVRGMLGLGVSEPMEYMFNSDIPLFTRALSLHHFWLPFLQMFLLKRLGYDKRAPKYYIPLSVAIFAACFLFTPQPPAPPYNPQLSVNINFIFGLNNTSPQTWMLPELWLLVVIIAAPLLLFLPAHVLFAYLFNPPSRHPSEQRS